MMDNTTNQTNWQPDDSDRGDRTARRPSTAYLATLAAIGFSVVTGLVIFAAFVSDEGRSAKVEGAPAASTLSDELEKIAVQNESFSPHLAAFYRARDYEPCWTTLSGLSRNGLELMRALSLAHDYYGPDPMGTVVRGGHARNYQLTYVDYRNGRSSSQRSADPADVARLEWRLSQGLRLLVEELEQGRVEPVLRRVAWFHDDEPFDVQELFEDIAERGPEAALKELRYSHEERTGLQAALELYESIDRAGGWGEVPATEATLERGVSSPAVEALRARLLTTGDLSSGATGDATDAQTFDEAVERAVMRFQSRHGLEPDGRVGERTLAALNVPSAVRLRQLQVNLERRRWLPARFERDYIWVNVPEYRLYAVNNSRVALRLNVIVGKPQTQTPLFADRLEYIVFNPYWNVPESIAVGELLPRHRSEPDYLASRGYEVVDRENRRVGFERLSREAIESGEVRIRRLPGPRNDLGRVKFIMPNQHNVYLHDTPSRSLFSRSERAFSHGCVRVEDPMKFASYLLGDRMHSSEVATARRANEGTVPPVVLDESVPVYVVYFTAFVVDGVVNFRDDIYGLDTHVWQALERSRDRNLETNVQTARLSRRQ